MPQRKPFAKAVISAIPLPTSMSSTAPIKRTIASAVAIAAGLCVQAPAIAQQSAGLLEEVIVTAGAKHSLTMNLLTFLEDGDEVIFPNPGYPPDEVWANYTNAVIKHTPLTKPDWQFNVDELEKKYGLNGDEFLTNAVTLMLNWLEPPTNHSILLKNAKEKGLIEKGYDIFKHKPSKIKDFSLAEKVRKNLKL